MFESPVVRAHTEQLATRPRFAGGAGPSTSPPRRRRRSPRPAGARPRGGAARHAAYAAGQAAVVGEVRRRDEVDAARLHVVEPRHREGADADRRRAVETDPVDRRELLEQTTQLDRDVDVSEVGNLLLTRIADGLQHAFDAPLAEASGDQDAVVAFVDEFQHGAGRENGETKKNKSECGDSLHKKQLSQTKAI